MRECTSQADSLTVRPDPIASKHRIDAVLAILLWATFLTSCDGAGGDTDRLQDVAVRGDASIVFVPIDTLRADRISAYGYERETTPNLDRLARFGVRFADAQAQSSWTKASMASLWTATYPRANGVTRWSHGLSEEHVLPAEILRGAGFRTVGLWRSGWVAPEFGFGQGFERYLRPRRAPPPPDVRAHNPSAARIGGTDLDAIASAVEFLHTCEPSAGIGHSLRDAAVR